MMHIDNEYDPGDIKKPLKKVGCRWSKTNWAWAWWNERKGRYICTCRPCKVPKRLRKEVS